jgi:Domain of unknown function (DUF4124)
MRQPGSSSCASGGDRSHSSRCNAVGLPLFVFGLLCVLAAGSATAQSVYKWTDDKGVVNYTTTPPDKRKAKTIDAAPAVAGQAVAPDYDEARYWRDRSWRETLRDQREERMRGDTEALHQSRLRSEAAANASGAASGARQKSMLESMIAQCKSERRVDCDVGPNGGPGFAAYGYTGYPSYPAVVVVRQTPTAPVTSPYFAVTPNFTHGFSKPLIYSNPR